MSHNQTEPGFNFANLDKQTKRSIRRAIVKAVAILEHQTIIPYFLDFQIKFKLRLPNQLQNK